MAVVVREHQPALLWPALFHQMRRTLTGPGRKSNSRLSQDPDALAPTDCALPN